MKNKIELTEWEKSIVSHLKRNRNKRDLFIATIPHVSSSGMSRQIKFAIIYKGEFLNITYLCSKILGKKLTRKDAISVSGYGMDMIFATLDHLYSGLGEKSPWKCAAVQHYKYF